MGLLRRLLGRNDAADDDPNVALDELETIRTLMATDHAQAAKRLWRAGKRFHARFGLGAPDPAVYRAAHQALHATPATASTDVAVTSYDAIGGEATEHPRYAHGAGAELEAIALLDAHPDAALVVIGDADLLVRVDFLRALDPPERVSSAVEVPQELTDLARAHGRTWLDVAL